MVRKIIWVGGAIGTITSALSIVKLVNHFLKIGFAGVPGFVLSSYTDFVEEIRYWLVERTFGLIAPEWLIHSTVIWLLFFGSNLRFLTYRNHGQTLFSGIGDVGYGRREPLKGVLLNLLNFFVAVTGPLFSMLVLFIWIANRKGGATGLGDWGDGLMISNRRYSVRIAKIYLLVLLLSPITAAAFFVWASADSLPRTEPTANLTTSKLAHRLG
jgi:hypothetical protein